MRPLSVIQLLPALASGGVERSTLEIARALVDAGHRSVVVSAGGRLVERLVAEGSTHLTLDIGRKSLLTLRHILSLRRVFAELQPDVVHARSRLPAWIGRLALGGQARRPHWVTTVHGLNSPSRYSRVMASGDAVICVSETVRAHVRRHYPDVPPERLVVIPRGIDPRDFPRGHCAAPDWLASHAQPALCGGRLLLMPGRGTRLKGHAEAIDLLAALRGEGVDARLWLLGAWEPGREAYLDELRARATTLGVAGQLVISPPIAGVRDAYAAADLVLQLSNKPEAFGRTVLEALAIGRPVLGWSHGGVGELLGELYPRGAVALGDGTGLKNAARSLLADPAPVPEHIPYTLQAMQAATLDVYDRLARARRTD